MLPHGMSLYLSHNAMLLRLGSIKRQIEHGLDHLGNEWLTMAFFMLQSRVKLPHAAWGQKNLQHLRVSRSKHLNNGHHVFKRGLFQSLSNRNHHQNRPLSMSSSAIFNSCRRSLHINPLLVEALWKKEPVVALESTIITHGMPFPQNIEYVLPILIVVLINHSNLLVLGRRLIKGGVAFSPLTLTLSKYCVKAHIIFANFSVTAPLNNPPTSSHGLCQVRLPWLL